MKQIFQNVRDLRNDSAQALTRLEAVRTNLGDDAASKLVDFLIDNLMFLAGDRTLAAVNALTSITPGDDAQTFIVEGLSEEEDATIIWNDFQKVWYVQVPLPSTDVEST
jgi:hypothetical protein